MAAIFGFEENIESEYVKGTLLILYKQSDLLSAAQDVNIFSKGSALSQKPVFLQKYDEAKKIQTQLTQELLAATASNPKKQSTIKTELQPALRVLVDESQKLLIHGDVNAVMVQNAAMNTVHHCCIFSADIQRVVALWFPISVTACTSE